MGIDLGTSGVKVLLMDRDGVVVSSETVEYALHHPNNGWAEQHPEEWWEKTALCIRKAMEKAGIKAGDVLGIGLTGQMHGLVMLDSQNEVIRPAIIWCDQRTEKECEEITERIGKDRLIEITANPALTGFTASKILWTKNNEPDQYERCRHILLPKDYIRHKLTGEYATDVSDASGMQILDVKNRCWSREVLDKLEINEEMLGKVYESPEVTGAITRWASEETGLQEGTPVVAGAGDNAAAAVGTGTVSDGKAFTTIGTSGVVFAHSSLYRVDPAGRVHTFCCAVPGAWHLMGVTQAAGLSLKWFRDHFCDVIVQKAEKENRDPYDLMTEMAQKVPLGSRGLIYLPYLMGERTPHLDPNSRGVFFGLSTIHEKPEMIRSIIEGVTFSLKDCFEVLKERDVMIDSMIASGGGAASTFWRQMMSDMFACSVVKVNNDQGPAYGAAILAGVGTQCYEGVESACRELIHSTSVSETNQDHHQRYNSYHQLYRNLYPALKEHFAHLSKLQSCMIGRKA